jgi:hypothetical protein
MHRPQPERSDSGFRNQAVQQRCTDAQSRRVDRDLSSPIFNPSSSYLQGCEESCRKGGEIYPTKWTTFFTHTVCMVSIPQCPLGYRVTSEKKTTTIKYIRGDCQKSSKFLALFYLLGKDSEEKHYKVVPRNQPGTRHMTMIVTESD